DVKAVEYFLKEKLKEAGGEDLLEWIHFGLTSQDINNTAVPMMWKNALEHEYLPMVMNLQQEILQLAKKWEKIPMLAKTHGQPASTTILGKEMMVFAERIETQVQQFSYIPLIGKFGSATGNLNAHHGAYPKTDWADFGNQFLEKKLGLQRQQYTAQIEHYH